MARILNTIIAFGGTTAHRVPFDERSIIDEFIRPERKISCVVASDGPQLLGFQALEWCDPNWPGDDPLPADWAVVATYVDPRAQKKGVGRALFVETATAARAARVRYIDATIRKENAGGRAYYQAMGFMDYRAGAETLSKRFAPAGNMSAVP